MWLDADDTSTILLNGLTVSQWNDKSSNQLVFQQTDGSRQPVYGVDDLTKATLNFDGVNDFLDGDDVLDTVWTGPAFQIFFVAKNNAVATQNGTILSKVSTSPLNLRQFGSYLRTNRSQIVTLYTPDTANYTVVNGSTVIADSQWVISSQAYTDTGTGSANTTNRVEIVVDGSEETEVVVASAGSLSTIQDTDAHLSVGAIVGDGTQPGGSIDGSIGEILVTSVVTSLDDRQKLEGYLAWKWGGLSPGAADYGAKATTAYSLRYVSNNYSGPVVRVRESSGNTEQDFTPTQITDGTLATFVGAGNDGFVTTWYDQSSNGNNAVQAVATSQPKIVGSGSLITENGRPAILFDGVNDSLATNGYIVELSQNNASVFAVGKFSGSYDLVESDSSSPYSSNFILSGPAGGTEIVWVNATSFGTKDPVNQSLMGFIYDGVNFQAYLNGAASGAAGPATVNPEVGNTTVIGSRVDFVIPFSTSALQEIIVYRSDESASRSAIESNMNQYYGIYS